MNIILKRSSDNPKKINKTFTTVKTITSSYPYEPLDDLNGYVIIDYTANSFNYVEIDGKTYFVREREKLEGRNYRIHLEEDVLTTWKSVALATPLIPDRASGGYNSYIADPLQKSQVDYDNFSYGFAPITSFKTIFNCVAYRGGHIDLDNPENSGPDSDIY